MGRTILVATLALAGATGCGGDDFEGDGAGGTAGSASATGGAGGRPVGAPVVMAEPPPSAGSASNGFVALDDDRVYFSYQGATAGGVAMVPKTAPGNVSCIECDVGHPREVAVDSAHVYWADVGLGELRRKPHGGGQVQTLWTGTVGTPIAIDSGSVYWFNSGSQSVMQATLSGTNPTLVAGSQSNVGSIEVDQEVLFWTTDSNVMSQDLSSGGARTTLASGRTHPKSVAVDSTHVYWVEGSWDQPDNAVMRVARSGGTLEHVTTRGTRSGYAIALDSTHAYVADNYGNTIWRVPKAPSGATDVLASTGQDYPFDIAVDDTHVYYTSETSAQLFVLAK